ncbi:MAG: UDP-N-acetylglucosamine--N-acetylmuramyl-(pentapeptide) pyrophosphoryl-undecaprenol N-acetylglucosamine transferase [Clostridia bacterium]|nr:UDP-N-acetylglucosamine--N-acetylmuramyl-(pentapeptide) pyrophosphoryl-undecaprenol N-acetylglucosamine transferase [Clostridia bacterium]
MKKILFTGGGSAGHVVPNIALIEELLSTGEADVYYMGTDSIEKSLIAEWKLPYYEISCPKLVRGGGAESLKRNLAIPAAFCRAKEQATEGLRLIQPDVVFSKGGYVSLPVVFAAKKLGIPCFSHESDYSAGLANKLLAGKCEYVFTSFPETAKKIRRGKYSGAPLRRSVLHGTKAESRKKFDIPFHATTLLIFGGGRGSAAINAAVRKHLKTLCENYYILHVCGKGNIVESNLKNYRQFEFIADMGGAYACADLVISRAGAGTIFELLALKKPSILVPLESASRGDQIENAAYFTKKGLCYTLRQNELDNLPKAIEKALGDKKMQERLLSSQYGCGNDVILREIRKFLQ